QPAVADHQVKRVVAALVVPGQAPSDVRLEPRGSSNSGQRLVLLDGEQVPQRFVGDAARHGVGDVLGRTDHDAELFVGQAGTLGGKAIDGAAVADAFAALELRDEKAEAKAGLLPGLDELRRQHLLDQFLWQQLSLRSLALREDKTEEPAEVGDG